MKWKITLLTCSLLIGVLYILPPLFVKYHLEKNGGVFVLNFETYRDEIFYLTRAHEVYDGHFPPTDPFMDSGLKNVQNPLPSLIMAAFIWIGGGDPTLAYLIAQFVFAQLSFLLFYWLGVKLVNQKNWALLFALVGILTPIATRILNFNGA